MLRLASCLAMLVVLGGVTEVSASQDILDWDTVDWPGPSSLSHAFSVASTQIEIAFSGDTSFVSHTSTPDDTTWIHGGFDPPEENLDIDMDWTTNTQSVTTTITFTPYAKDVSFTLFDVDILSGGAYDHVDQVTLSGTWGGATVFPTILGSPANVVAGNEVTGIANSPNQGPGSNEGNVQVLFDEVSTITLVFGNGPGAPANPGSQGIGLHDIQFTPTPEPSTLILVVMGALGLLAYGWRRRA